jgi:hypothetical protein
MKDEQGTVIPNPETIKVINNLRGKARFEGKDRNYYLDLMVKCLRIKHKGGSDMGLVDDYGQQWCIQNGIIGYDYIVSISVKNIRPKGGKDG